MPALRLEPAACHHAAKRWLNEVRMRRPRTASGLLPVVGVMAALAGPVAAEGGPRPLSLGDMQGFAISTGAPRQPPPVAAAPAVEVVGEPAWEMIPRPAARPADLQVVPPVADEDVPPGIIIRAGEARPAARSTTPAPIVALAPSPSAARMAVPQARPTPVIGGLPEARPVPALVLPRPRPAAPAPRPASLGAVELQAIALTPGGRATGPAAVAARPTAPEPEAPVTEAKVEPAASTPATPRGPLQLGADDLVAVGLRTGGAAEAP
jgi:hypothetical protein